MFDVREVKGHVVVAFEDVLWKPINSWRFKQFYQNWMWGKRERRVYLLTFCPPGPEDLEKLVLASLGGMTADLDFEKRVYHCRATSSSSSSPCPGWCPEYSLLCIHKILGCSIVVVLRVLHKEVCILHVLCDSIRKGTNHEAWNILCSEVIEPANGMDNFYCKDFSMSWNH